MRGHRMNVFWIIFDVIVIGGLLYVLYLGLESA